MMPEGPGNLYLRCWMILLSSLVVMEGKERSRMFVYVGVGKWVKRIGVGCAWCCL